MLEKYLFYFQYDKLSSFLVIITLLPLILISWRRAYIDPSFRLLQVFLILKFAIDIWMFHCAANRINNVALLNITTIFRYVLLSGMFYYKFEHRSNRRFLVPTAIVFSIFTLADIWLSNPDLTNLHEHRVVIYALTVESLLMIFWILLYFYELIRSLKIPNLLAFPFFWVCAGLLLYYSSLIFIAPALHYTFKWDEWLDIGFLDRVPYIFEIVSVILFSIGIWVFSTHRYAGQ